MGMRDPAVTSRIMAAIRSRDGEAEVRLRRELWRRGWRYRLHVVGVVGKPDIVFSRQRVVVYVDGDFWHGRSLLREAGARPLGNSFGSRGKRWWTQKLLRTIERDRYVGAQLEAQCWLVIRIWESDVLSDVPGVARKLHRILSRRSHSSKPEGRVVRL